MVVDAVSGSAGPDWSSYQNYVDSIRESGKIAVDKIGEARIPADDDNSNSGLEGFVLGGGVVDGNGELIAAVPDMKYVDTSGSDYVRESENDSDIYGEVRQKSDKSRILSYKFVQEMFPVIVNSMWGNDSGGNFLDNLFGRNNTNDGLIGLLNNINVLNEGLYNFQDSLEHGSLSDESYSGFFELNNPKIDELADSIVGAYGAVTNDDKAWAIRDWVQKNLEYVSDMENWGMN